ncbi:MAG TPA: hypothetical protein VK502_01235 [Candidatus Saccharimonadales bacterium]|nr:hypothetical protein [Candidatus Saccharimonadales bacterium]
MEQKPNGNTPEKPEQVAAAEDHRDAVERNTALFRSLETRSPDGPFNPLRAAINEAIERARAENGSPDTQK